MELKWEDIKEYFLPEFKKVISDYKSINYSLLRPTKKYIKTSSEIIIFYSLQASQETYKFFMASVVFQNPEEFSALIIELYKKLYIYELKMAFTLFLRSKKETPTINEIRKIIFLARYEGDGPSESSEKILDDYIALHFFNSIKSISADKENVQLIMGNIYNHIWQTGQFIKENYINSKNPNYQFEIDKD